LLIEENTVKLSIACTHWGKKHQARTTSFFLILPSRQSVLLTVAIKELKNYYVLLSSAMVAYTKEKNSFSRKDY